MITNRGSADTVMYTEVYTGLFCEECKSIHTITHNSCVVTRIYYTFHYNAGFHGAFFPLN